MKRVIGLSVCWMILCGGCLSSQAVAVTRVIAGSASASSGSATPGRIIDRWKKATGASALSKLRRANISGSVKSSDGSTGTFSIQTSYPDQLRLDIESRDLKLSECHNGKSAWRLDERGLRTLLGVEAKSLKLEALLLAGHLADLGRNRILPVSGGTARGHGRTAGGG